MHMRPHRFSLYFLYFVLAHYHGHEKCTSDHGHDSHSHHAKEEACTDGGHEHSHSHKKEEDAACGGEDGHDHGAFCRLRCLPTNSTLYLFLGTTNCTHKCDRYLLKSLFFLLLSDSTSRFLSGNLSEHKHEHKHGM